MGFFVQKIFIEDEEVFGANNIKLDFNLENLISTGSFNIPDLYSNQEFIKKQSRVEIYCGYVENTNFVLKEQLVRRFKGYITGVTNSISKTNRTLTINVMDQLEFLSRNDLQVAIGGDSSLQSFLELLIGQIVGLYPLYELDYYIGPDTVNAIPKIDSSPNAIELLSNIKKNLVVNIFYNSITGQLNVISPYFTQFLWKDQEIEVYDFNLNNMVGVLNYGDLTNNINKVVYVGAGGVKGVASDYSAIALGQGGQELRFYDMTTGSKEALEEKARNKLLDVQKNHQISFTVPLTESMLNVMPGELCRINDYNKFTGREVFIIKSISMNITKDDLSVEISAYAHTLTEFPEELVLTKFGITDEDILKVLEKEVQENFS